MTSILQKTKTKRKGENDFIVWFCCLRVLICVCVDIVLSEFIYQYIYFFPFLKLNNHFSYQRKIDLSTQSVYFLFLSFLKLNIDSDVKALTSWFCTIQHNLSRVDLLKSCSTSTRHFQSDFNLILEPSLGIGMPWWCKEPSLAYPDLNEGRIGIRQPTTSSQLKCRWRQLVARKVANWPTCCKESLPFFKLSKLNEACSSNFPMSNNSCIIQS